MKSEIKGVAQRRNVVFWRKGNDMKMNVYQEMSNHQRSRWYLIEPVMFCSHLYNIIFLPDDYGL